MGSRPFCEWTIEVAPPEESRPPPARARTLVDVVPRSVMVLRGCQPNARESRLHLRSCTTTPLRYTSACVARPCDFLFRAGARSWDVAASRERPRHRRGAVARAARVSPLAPRPRRRSWGGPHARGGVARWRRPRRRVPRGGAGPGELACRWRRRELAAPGRRRVLAPRARRALPLPWPHGCLVSGCRPRSARRVAVCSGWASGLRSKSRRAS